MAFTVFKTVGACKRSEGSTPSLSRQPRHLQNGHATLILNISRHLPEAIQQQLAGWDWPENLSDVAGDMAETPDADFWNGLGQGYFFGRCPNCAHYPLERRQNTCPGCQQQLHRFTFSWPHGRSPKLAEYVEEARQLGTLSETHTDGRLLYHLEVNLGELNPAQLGRLEKLCFGPDGKGGVMKLTDSQVLHGQRWCRGALFSSWYPMFWEEPELSRWDPPQVARYAVSLWAVDDSWYT